jgi:hypothetical protein
MPFDAPFQLGPFAVGADGRLALAAPTRPPQFHIDWRGCRVDALLRTGGDNALGELSLRAVVGRVPSTARGAFAPAAPPGTAGRREAVFDALRALPSALPQGWRADLLADHRVVLLSAAQVAMPTTVNRLLTDVTLFLLALGPYLDLLAELGVEAAPPT